MFHTILISPYRFGGPSSLAKWIPSILFAIREAKEQEGVNRVCHIRCGLRSETSKVCAYRPRCDSIEFQNAVTNQHVQDSKADQEKIVTSAATVRLANQGTVTPLAARLSRCKPL